MCPFCYPCLNLLVVCSLVTQDLPSRPVPFFKLCHWKHSHSFYFFFGSFSKFILSLYKLNVFLNLEMFPASQYHSWALRFQLYYLAWESHTVTPVPASTALVWALQFFPLFSLTCLLSLSLNMFQAALPHLFPLFVNTSGNGVLNSYCDGNLSPCVFYPILSSFFVDSFPSRVRIWLLTSLRMCTIFHWILGQPPLFEILKSFNILSWFKTISNSPTDVSQKSKIKEKNIL